MAIKEIKREWSPCQCGYVKTFLCHSEADVKELPKCCEGSKATVSETGNVYLCTESGWVNGAGYDDNGSPKPVVILPETELTVMNPGTQYTLDTPLENTPTGGSTYKLVFDGVEYISPALDVSETVADGELAFAFGDSSLLFGDNAASIGNPVPGAPYFLMLVPNGTGNEGEQTTYGMIFTTVEPTTPVLSIVQTEGGSEDSGDDGGVMTVRVTASSENKDMALSGCDKTFAEFMSAYNEGKLIRIIAAVTDETIEYVGNVVYFNNTTPPMFAIAMPYATGTTTKQFLLYAADDGSATIASLDND